MILFESCSGFRLNPFYISFESCLEFYSNYDQDFVSNPIKDFVGIVFRNLSRILDTKSNPVQYFVSNPVPHEAAEVSQWTACWSLFEAVYCCLRLSLKSWQH